MSAGLQRCTQTLRPQDDVGYARVAQRCPEFVRLLRESAIAPWLPAGWNEPHNDLSAAGLGELLRLQQQWQAPPIESSTVAQPAQLQALVAQLNLHEAERNSLWKRFRSWLRALFDRQSERDVAARSFSDWWRAHGFSEDLWSTLQWSALTLLALLAARIIGQELLTLVGPRRERAAAGSKATGGPALPTLAEIEAAALLSQPGMLLALVVDLLTRQRKLRAGAALTVRELTRDAQRINEPQREQLDELATAAEPVRFAAAPPAPGILQNAISSGKALVQRLQGQVP